MMQNVEQPEARVRRLENIEAIRRLKCELATQLDAMINEAGSERPVLDCFSEDAVWASAEFGSYKGHSQLSEFLKAYRSRISFSLSFMLNHIITVGQNGTTAVGHWTTWSPMTFKGKPLLLAGHYDDAYVVADDTWKIASSQLRVKFISNYKKGWAEERLTKSWDFFRSNAGVHQDVT